MPKGELQPVHSLILGDYPILEPAFLSEVGHLKQGDPLRPLIVLVPSHLLGLHLSRYLADNDLSHINIRFLTLADLAAHVASPALLKAGRAGASQLLCVQLLAEITAKLVQRDPEFYFSAISDRMGFHEAMLSALHDLKRACVIPEDLLGLLEKQRVKTAVNMRKLKNVQEIWQAYEARMEELGWHDGCDVLRMACREAAGSKLLSESSALLIYGFYDFDALQKRFATSCSEGNNMIAFVPFAPERAFDYVRPFIAWLKSQGFKEKAPEQAGARVGPGPIPIMCNRLFSPGGAVKNIEDSLAIISAPGEVREVREVIRFVAHEAVDQNVALHDTAILLRHSHPYASMFRNDFGNLGLEPYILEGPEIRETRAGRSLCLLVDVLRHDYARRAVMEFATFAHLDLKMFYGKGEDVKPVTLWDLITMDAGIVEGKGEWDSHLGELLKQQEVSQARGRLYTNEAIRALIKFSNHLIKALTSLREATTWSEMVSRLLSAYTSLVEPDEQTPDVTKAVSQLSRLDETDIEPSTAGLLDLIDEVLSETVPRS
jgi:ATP-dependent helicase/DNAse subunit B